MQKQIINYINQYLLPCYVGTETALLYFMKTGTLYLIKKNTYLPKTFDTMNYKLLVTKRNAYGFSKEAPKLIFS